MAVGLAVSAGFVSADDWTGFRGNNSDGKSAEANLLAQWPDDGPELIWTADALGTGFSSVSISGDHLFTCGDIGDEQCVFCVSTVDGSEVWRSAVDASNENDFAGTRSTPALSDGKVYVLTTAAVLCCLNAEDGELLWKKDLAAECDARIMLAKGQWEWQFSESPLIDENRVVVTPGGAGAVMMAFDKDSGDELWRCDVPEIGELGCDGAGYSTAVISNACGVKQYVQVVGRGVIGVEAETGRFLWGYNRIANDVANISSPVVDGNYVFASTGYQTGAALLELSTSAAGDFEVEERYFLTHDIFQNHHGGFILHDGCIFGGQGHKMGLPVCIELETGEVQWGPVRNRGRESAAICFADGHLYYRYQNGLMVLIEANRSEYVEKSSFMIPDVEQPSWSHPVVCGGKLYLKEQGRLHCYDISEEDRGTTASGS